MICIIILTVRILFVFRNLFGGHLRREEKCSGKTGSMQTLRVMQAKINSVLSSFSKMLEEALNLETLRTCT